MRREDAECPVCLNVCGHVSKDGGETWSCDTCMATHDFEARVGTDIWSDANAADRRLAREGRL